MLLVSLLTLAFANDDAVTIGPVNTEATHVTHAPETASHGHHMHAGVHAVEGATSDGHLGTGVGASVGVPVAHGALECEVVTQYVKGEHHAALPINLLLGLPMHLTNHLDAFVALGPGVEVEMTEHETRLIPVGTLADGGQGWLGEHAGVSLEVDYSWMVKEGAAHGVRVFGGPMIRL